MKKWLALPVLALALLLAYVVAGPFLAYNGIQLDVGPTRHGITRGSTTSSAPSLSRIS